MKGQVLTELSRIANNITTSDSGYVLDARQASVLREAGKDFLIFTHSKSGTIHNLTLSGKNGENIKFVATADFNEGDTFKINGTSVTAKMTDGNPLQDKYFVNGSIIIAFKNNNNLYFIGQKIKKIETPLMITLESSDNTSTAGRTVTITNLDDNSIFETFIYNGTSHTSLIPVGMHYRITCSAINNYTTPEPVEYTSIADTPRSVILRYRYYLRYGFKREKTNSNPNDRITYLYDAVGMTPMYVDLTTGEPDYGSWKDFIDIICRPVMLKTDGTVDYELNHTDQTKRFGNDQPSDIDNINYDGNAMVEFNEAFKWVKRYEDANYEYVIFCNIQFDDTYHAYAHTNINGEIKDAFYWGMFKGTYSNEKLRSIGTGNVMVSTNRTTEINRAVANGNSYYTIYKSGWDYICDLLTLVGKNDDSQGIFGYGRQKTGVIAVGTLKSTGAFFGKSDSTTDVKVFYIEGFWGNVWEGLAGMISNKANILIKMTPPYNTTGIGYTSTGIKVSGTSGGYINNTSCTDAFGFVPKTTGGSMSTYICDGLWYKTDVVGYPAIGGDYSRPNLCGSRCITYYWTISQVGNTISSRISYIPV